MEDFKLNQLQIRGFVKDKVVSTDLVPEVGIVVDRQILIPFVCWE